MPSARDGSLTPSPGVARLLAVCEQIAPEGAPEGTPSTDELIAALEEDGPLSDKPAVRALLAERDTRPALTLIQGGDGA